MVDITHLMYDLDGTDAIHFAHCWAKERPFMASLEAGPYSPKRGEYWIVMEDDQDKFTLVMDGEVELHFIIDKDVDKSVRMLLTLTGWAQSEWVY